MPLRGFTTILAEFTTLLEDLRRAHVDEVVEASKLPPSHVGVGVQNGGRPSRNPEKDMVGYGVQNEYSEHESATAIPMEKDAVRVEFVDKLEQQQQQALWHERSLQPEWGFEEANSWIPSDTHWTAAAHDWAPLAREAAEHSLRIGEEFSVSFRDEPEGGKSISLSLIEDSTVLATGQATGKTFKSVVSFEREGVMREATSCQPPQSKRQYQIRSPWSDYGEYSSVCVAQTLGTAKLITLKQQRCATMASLKEARPSFNKARIPKDPSLCSRLVQHPDSISRSLWILACMAFLMYDLIMVPVDACFDLKDSPVSGVIDTSSMIFWTIDIIYAFFTGVQTQNYLEMRPRWIAWRYARSYLLFDMLLVIPEWIAFSSKALDTEYLGFIRGVRLGRLFRMLRVARIFRMLRMQPALRRVIFKFHLADAYLHVSQGWVGLGLVILYVMHLASCAWYGLGNALDDGWVHAHDLSSASDTRAYIISAHWCASRLHGLMTSRRLNTEVEMLVDALLIYCSMVWMSLYIGRVTSVIMARTTSRTMALWKYSIAYSQRHSISPEVDRRLIKFLQASRSGGMGEAQSEEKELLRSLPLSLGHDLLFEARVKYVMEKPFFRDMDLLNERVLRTIIVSMSSQFFIEQEVIFADGDACHAVLFLTDGCFWYAYNTSPVRMFNELNSLSQETDTNVPEFKVAASVRSMNSLRRFAKSTASSSSENPLAFNQKLLEMAVISEPVLWTKWEHNGTLLAQEDSIALSLSTNLFAEVLMQHVGPCLLHIVRYATHFVWHLNHVKKPNDLTEFLELTIGNLDDKLFDGTLEDHFLFISHYKVEAGTEATLMRDSLESLLSANPGHPANNLHSPIFIDSEDLMDLAELQNHVQKSETLVLLLTPGVLERPWCLIEIVTAVRHDVGIVPVEVQRPGSSYRYPDEEFYDSILRGRFLSKESLNLLEQENVTLQDVEQAIRQVFHKIALPFSPHKTKSVREAELTDIWKRCVKASRSADGIGAKTGTPSAFAGPQTPQSLQSMR